MPEKKRLVEDIDFAIYEKAVEVWKRYYEGTERIDREYPHAPSRYDNGVIPIPSPWTKEHRQRIRNAAKFRDEGLRNMPQRIIDEGKETALQMHDAELEPCGCEGCRRARGRD